ncbi:MAG: cytochrome c peroxidase [Acidobacteriota bacterium]
MRNRSFVFVFVAAASVLMALHGSCAPSGEAPVPATQETAAGGAPELPPGETLVSGDFSMRMPLGLQADSAYIPDANPLSEAKIALGKMLYFDGRLSRDGTISCATCHLPERGFSDGRPTSTGIGDQVGGRNAPTVINRLFSAEQFWDGRAEDLEAQALGPVQNPIEMGHTLEGMVSALDGIRGYREEFQTVFGGGITAERVAQAIASYERTVLAGNAPFDRYSAGDKPALSAPAVRGMEIFNDPERGNCVTCHAGFNFTDESYHNLGVGMDRPEPDLGRFVVSGEETDRGAFKTPTLRNITQSGPYMHDGSEETLAEVIDLYDRGGVKNPWLSAEMRPLNLSAEDKQDLIAFLESLTGEVTNADPPVSLP